MNRRSFLHGSAAFAGWSAVGLTGCAKKTVTAPAARCANSTVL